MKNSPVMREIRGGEIRIVDRYDDGSGYPGLEIELWGPGSRVRLKMTGIFALEFASSLVRRVVEGERRGWREPGFAENDPGQPIVTPPTSPEQI